MTPFMIKEHSVDLCVVGGGLAGMCAAVAAARRGNRVVLMHDRPVLGGNASSEIRMWIRGANGEDLRETGIVEEIALENIYRNPDMNFAIWDSVLYEIVMREKNIELLLNCSCLDAKMEKDRILSVTGWQLTTQMYHRVSAAVFADCSGDSILAPLTGALCRVGREAQEEFEEAGAPVKADSYTMGLSCLIQARQTDHPVKYIAPEWAYRYTREDFPYRMNVEDPKQWSDDNFWWMELGGIQDTIHETETIRDELIKMAYGVWDFIKNGGVVEADCWDLEWVGFLPGKRESRRYVGAHVLNQKEVQSGGHFQDLIAYGGWTMDDHNPKGFLTREEPNTHYPAAEPYGIPYRCLYSPYVENLMFAGRNISATHMASSSTRVMATCAILGQAVGTAAAIAVKESLLPGKLYHSCIDRLQQELMEDGCYLPWHRRRQCSVMQGAVITAGGREASILLDGVERRVDGVDHAWEGKIGDEIILELPESRRVREVRMVFDCDLNRVTWENQKWYAKRYPMKCNTFLDDVPVHVPGTILKSYEISIDSGDGQWKTLYREENNYQYLQKLKLEDMVKRLKFIPLKTWGAEKARLYALELLGKLV